MNIIKNILTSYSRKSHTCPTGTCTPISRAIEPILQRRLDSVKLETKRLLQNPKIQYLADGFSQTPENMCIMQTMELQEAIKDTHFVFNHGGSGAAMVAHMTAKKMLEIFEKQIHTHFEVLRHPVFLTQVSDKHDVAFFKQALSNHLEGIYRNEVLSADICLHNRQHKESAYSFFTALDADTPSHIEKVVETILAAYIPHKKTAIAKQIAKLGETVPSGCLYSICVPHHLFSSIGYVSRPFGHPIDKFHTLSDIRLCQEGYPFHLMSYGSFPQVRLLAHKLLPSHGVCILPHTTLHKSQLADLEKKISDYFI